MKVPCQHVMRLMEQSHPEMYSPTGREICVTCLQEFDAEHPWKPPTYKELVALKASLPCGICGGSGLAPCPVNNVGCLVAHICSCAVGQKLLPR